MRKVININKNWTFIKDVENLRKARKQKGNKIDLPHTYNNVDGQDGGNDYFRGTCWYKYDLGDLKLHGNDRAYLEFNGAAINSDVYLNKKHLSNHQGGYSKFRVDITESLSTKNELMVSVNNSENDYIYPQAADFTFYGGIYRDVNLIIVPSAHFDLGYYGSDGIKITPEVNGNNAKVTVEVWTVGNPEFVEINTNNETKKVNVVDNYAIVEFFVNDARLWDGTNDPYLYDLTAKLDSGDEVHSKYGLRYFEIDPEKGFLLNGKKYPLRGVSRHQDRADVGNALSEDMHQEDMDMILEIGANSLRLAHYQHAQEFYDLCDEHGLIVWAEIPYITMHMPNGRENTIQQMKDLVIQNYNHPSIAVWGLSNEISAGSDVSEDLIENHVILNDICHKLDKTRLTTLANVFMLETDSPLLEIPDVNSYNLYFGWYLGSLEENDEFFDKFHEKYPNMPIGFSEYGADANPQFQSSDPVVGDYTESYQTVYHEHMLEMISKRDWLWSTYVWNMFDFAADGRDEGGKHGENQKGLVTMDRKIKKDAFYLYKAYWNKKDDFVHLTGRRYVDRTEKTTEVKVYSNLEEVSLYIDGNLLETKKGQYVFKFNVDINNEHTIKAVSGEYEDTITIKYVEKPNEAYVFSGHGDVVNWLDTEIIKEGYFSVNDTFGEIRKNEEANNLVNMIMGKASETRGDVAKHVKDNKGLAKMLSRMTIASLLKHAGDAVTEEQVQMLNMSLQKIKK